MSIENLEENCNIRNTVKFDTLRIIINSTVAFAIARLLILIPIFISIVTLRMKFTGTPPRQGLNKDYFHHGHRHHCGAHSSLNSNEEKHKPTPESAVKSIYITVPSKFLVILIAEKSPCILTLT